MPEIRVQRPNTSPEVELGEIHIPNDEDWGTGTFTSTFRSRALLSGKVVASIMLNPPFFQISATFNPNGEIVVLLGQGNAPRPQATATFKLPGGIDRFLRHKLLIEFSDWQIPEASLDGADLEKA